jgi:N-acetylneuraminic acid mutarotase
VYEYDLKNNSKLILKTNGTKPPTREHHTCVHYKNEIIVFGGFSEVNKCTDLYALNLSTKKWRILNSNSKLFTQSIFHHTSSVFGDDMFVFGGVLGSEPSSNLYKYSFLKDEWEILQTNQNNVFTPTPRFKHSSFIFQECLYILGGRNFVNYCPDMFCFNLKTNKWRKILFTGSFPNEILASPLVFENSIIVSNQDSIFEYHLKNKCWEEKNFEETKLLLNICFM